MKAGNGALRDLALSTGGPVALAVAGVDGSLLLEWVNGAMAALLGLEPGDDTRVPLDDVLTGSDGARVTATVRDLIDLRGQSASVQVSALRGDHADPIWFHLLVAPDRRMSRLSPRMRRRRARRVVLHAQVTSSAALPGPDRIGDGRGHLVDRLGTALSRLRRRPSRVALALVSVLQNGLEGPQPPPGLQTADLADRVRQVARETDTVVVLAPGWLAVLVEDPTDGGEIAMARRALAALRRSGAAGPEGGPLVAVTVQEITDPGADPDAVLASLHRTAARVALDGGVTVLDPWQPDTTPAGRPDGTVNGTGSRQQIQRALRSGRFVLGRRAIEALAPDPQPDAGGVDRPATVTPSKTVLLEVGTVDEDVLSPVRVTAPGLAAALDQWVLRQARGLATDGSASTLVIRLQPSSGLGPDLSEAAAELARARPEQVVLQVPEARLAEILVAERAVLHRLSESEVRLAVSAWSGRIEVPALVRWHIGLVELSPTTQQEVLRPEGAALVTALTAGLHAGLGPAALVVAEWSYDPQVRAALSSCGVLWATPPETVIMVTG
ncbi:hypothetical protein [Geodermatophilus sp. SYSU D00696]